MDLIITDHHEPSVGGILPNVLAIINPKRKGSLYPFNSLSGVGVAFKLMLAVAVQIGCNHDAIVHQLIEFVALGTIADMMPIIRENRFLVAQGCKALSKSSKPGIQALLNISSIRNVDSNSIGFYIAPLINACARMGFPHFALELLLAKNKQIAKNIAIDVADYNQQRKIIQDEMTIKILQSLVENSDDSIIFSSGENYHKGLLGLAANSIMDIYEKPTFICNIDNEGKVRGSCRSQKPFSLTAVKEINEEHEILYKLGGHQAAFGFELPAENLLIFRELLNKRFAEFPNEDEALLEIDARLPFEEININTYQTISTLSPYGNGNSEPIFLTENIVVESCNSIANGKHLKLQLSDPSRQKNVIAIWWRMGSEINRFHPGAKVDAVYKLGINEFRGTTDMQLVIEDLQTIG